MACALLSIAVKRSSSLLFVLVLNQKGESLCIVVKAFAPSFVVDTDMLPRPIDIELADVEKDIPDKCNFPKITACSRLKGGMEFNALQA